MKSKKIFSVNVIPVRDYSNGRKMYWLYQIVYPKKRNFITGNKNHVYLSMRMNVAITLGILF